MRACAGGLRGQTESAQSSSGSDLGVRGVFSDSATGGTGEQYGGRVQGIRGKARSAEFRARTAFYVAMGDAKVSYLDVGDIAVVAVKALHGGAHAGKTYELNGPEAISNQELAKRISKVTGRTVNYVDIPESAQRESMLGLGMPEWHVTALLELQQYYKQGGGART